MGKKSGGSEKQTTSTTPYLKNDVKAAAKAAADLYNAGGGYYQGSQIAPLSAETTAALDAIAGRANGGMGNGLNNAAADQYLATIRGDYLNSNPYLQQVIDASAKDVTRNFTNSVLPELNSSFAQSGRYGSGLQEQAINNAVNTTSQNIADAAANIRSQNYANERANQLNAAGGAAAVNAARYQDAQQLAGVGASRDALAQARLDDQINQYQLKQTALDDYITRIGQLGQGYGTTTQQTRNNGGGLLGTLGGLAAIGGAVATGGSSLGLWGLGSGGMAAAGAASTLGRR